MTEEEKKTLSDLFEAMGKTGAQFQIGQVIGSQSNTYNYYGEPLGGARSGGQGAGSEVPEQLEGEDAKGLMGRLVDEGMLSEDWQAQGLSGSERALVAKAVCDRLEVNEVWKVFGTLWEEKPDTLRSYYNKAMNQAKSLDFQDELKKILR